MTTLKVTKRWITGERVIEQSAEITFVIEPIPGKEPFQLAGDLTRTLLRALARTAPPDEPLSMEAP